MLHVKMVCRLQNEVESVLCCLRMKVGFAVVMLVSQKTMTQDKFILLTLH